MEQLSSPSFYDGANLLMIGSNNPWLMTTGGKIYTPYTIFGDMPSYLSWFDGFHPFVIRAKLRELTGRYIIATVNGSVIDNFHFESADHARKSIFLLQDDHFFGLSEDEAHEFFRSYEVGIQHVSEILLTSGLWR